MNPRIVLFEDHTLARFRPLAWSTPVTEIRCGMFSLRERVGLLTGTGGSMAIRPHLAALVTDPDWSGLEAGDAGPCLWLAGRLAPDPTTVEALLTAGRHGAFALQDEGGLLAACGDGAASGALADSWLAWSAGADTLADTCPQAWTPPVPPTWGRVDLGSGLTWRAPEAGGAPAPAGLAPALGWIWDVVPRTAAAVAADLALAVDRTVQRHPYALVPTAGGTAPWHDGERLTAAGPDTLVGVTVLGEGGVYVGAGVSLLPGTVLDTRPGPVVLAPGVSVGAHVMLEGPLFIGAGSRVKAGACIYGESSFGLGCRIAGEIGESTFGDFSNKQHEGFIGHAVLGSWVNLGAMTTCSDLKNNYGNVRVDLGWGSIDTGLRFVGLLMGDHAKTAIGTLFNTGTCVGFAANVFGEGMPPKFVPSFSWGGRDGSPAYALDKAMHTAGIVMARRGCVLADAHGALFALLGSP